MALNKSKASEVTGKAFAARDMLKDNMHTFANNIDGLNEHIERAKLVSKAAVDIGTSGVRADVITSGMMTEMSTFVRRSNTSHHRLLMLLLILSR